MTDSKHGRDLPIPSTTNTTTTNTSQEPDMMASDTYTNNNASYANLPASLGLTNSGALGTPMSSTNLNSLGGFSLSDANLVNMMTANTSGHNYSSSNLGLTSTGPGSSGSMGLLRNQSSLWDLRSPHLIRNSNGSSNNLLGMEIGGMAPSSSLQNLLALQQDVGSGMVMGISTHPLQTQQHTQYQSQHPPPHPHSHSQPHAHSNYYQTTQQQTQPPQQLLSGSSLPRPPTFGSFTDLLAAEVNANEWMAPELNRQQAADAQLPDEPELMAAVPKMNTMNAMNMRDQLDWPEMFGGGGMHMSTMNMSTVNMNLSHRGNTPNPNPSPNPTPSPFYYPHAAQNPQNPQSFQNLQNPFHTSPLTMDHPLMRQPTQQFPLHNQLKKEEQDEGQAFSPYEEDDVTDLEEEEVEDEGDTEDAIENEFSLSTSSKAKLKLKTITQLAKPKRKRAPRKRHQKALNRLKEQVRAVLEKSTVARQLSQVHASEQAFLRAENKRVREENANLAAIIRQRTGNNEVLREYLNQLPPISCGYSNCRNHAKILH